MAFTLPLATLSDGTKVEFPLGLSYKGGIKLHQAASDVGLGFAINTGSIVRRPVLVSDDETGANKVTGGNCELDSWRNVLNWILAFVILVVDLVMLVALSQTGDTAVCVAMVAGLTSAALSLFNMGIGFVSFSPGDHLAGGEHNISYDYEDCDAGYFVGHGKAYDLPDQYFLSCPYVSGELVYVGKQSSGEHAFVLKTGSSPNRARAFLKDDVFTVHLADGTRLIFGQAVKGRVSTSYVSWYRHRSEDADCWGTVSFTGDLTTQAWHLTTVLQPGFVGDPANPSSSEGGGWVSIEYLEINQLLAHYGVSHQADERTASKASTALENMSFVEHIRTATQNAYFHYVWDRLDSYMLAGSPSPATDGEGGLVFDEDTKVVLGRRLDKITIHNYEGDVQKTIHFNTDYTLRPGNHGSVASTRYAVEDPNQPGHSIYVDGTYYVFDGINGITEGHDDVRGNPDKGVLTLKSIEFFAGYGTGPEASLKTVFAYGRNPAVFRRETYCREGGTEHRTHHAKFTVEDRDLWGYYRAPLYNNGQPVYPYRNDFNVTGTYEKAKECDAWSLTRATFPDGHSILWEYEPNRYDMANNVGPRTSESGKPMYGGGPRVKKVTVTDGMGGKKVNAYFYADMETPGDFSDANLKTSGHATAEPYPYLAATDPRPTDTRGSMYTGTKVAYERVIVVEGYQENATVKAPAGYKVMDYYTSADAPNIGKYGQTDRSWRRGQLKSVKWYNSRNRLLSEENYDYRFTKVGDLVPRIDQGCIDGSCPSDDVWGFMEYGLVQVISKRRIKDGVARIERYVFADDSRVLDSPSDRSTAEKQIVERLGEPAGATLLETSDIDDGFLEPFSVVGQSGNCCIYGSWLYSWHLVTGAQISGGVPYFSKLVMYSMRWEGNDDKKWTRVYLGEGVRNGQFEGRVDLAACKVGHFGGDSRQWDLLCVVRGKNKVRLYQVLDRQNEGTWIDLPVAPDFTACCFADPEDYRDAAVWFIYPKVKSPNFAWAHVTEIADPVGSPQQSTAYNSLGSFVEPLSDGLGGMASQPRATMIDADGDGMVNDLGITMQYDLLHDDDGYTDSDNAIVTYLYPNLRLYPPHGCSHDDVIVENVVRGKLASFTKLAAQLQLPDSRERVGAYVSYGGSPDRHEYGHLRAFKSHHTYVYDVDGRANWNMECDANGTVLRTTTIVPAFEQYPEMKTLGMLTYDYSTETYEGQVSAANERAANATTWMKLQGSGDATYMPRVGYAWRASCDDKGVPVNTKPAFTGSASEAWVPGAEVTMYSAKANPVETKGPTGRYSTTLYDQNEVLALASVTNARYGECLFSSFEEEDVGEFTNRVGPGAQAAIVDDQHHAGSKCLSLSKKSSDDPYYLTCDTPLNTALSDDGEKKIRWEFWARKADGVQATTGFTHLQTCDDASSWYGATYFELSTQWRKYHFEATVPNGKIKQRFHVVLRPPRRESDGQYIDGTVYYDDVRAYPADALMTSTVYDPLLNQPTWSCDVNNNCRETEYDGFGRVIAEFNAAGKKVSEYEYHTMCEDGEGTPKFTHPSAGDQLDCNMAHEVRWQVACPGDSKVTLQWRKSSGAWNVLLDKDDNEATDLDIGRGSFKWHIPSIGFGEEPGCRIRMKVDVPPTSDPSGMPSVYYVEMDGTFVIFEPGAIIWP